MNTATARETEFAQLIGRFYSGDAGALTRLYTEYGEAVRTAVRRRLPDRLRKEYDSLDFAHDVWASFCHIPPGTHTFTSPEDLGGFLARIAQFKVIEVCRRRFQTEAYDVTREQPLHRVKDGAVVPLPLPGRGATPSQVAIADERWAAIAAILPASHLAVIERLREGYTQKEVAEMSGMTDRNVRRIVDRVKELCGVAS